MVKHFILDTNIILSSGSGGGSKVLNGFVAGKDANVVVICSTVLQELDKHKTDSGEVGYNARDFIRALDDLRTQGDLTKGVKTERGKVLVEPDGVKEEYLPKGVSLEIADNRIISTCIHLAKKNPRSHYVFVSNDVSCRVNADFCFKAAGVDIAIESYKNDQMVSRSDDIYKGYKIIENEDPRLVQALFEDDGKQGVPYKDEDIIENEYVYMPESKIIAVHKKGRLVQIHEPSVFGLKKLQSPAQIMAMHALLAPAEEIPLVILTGAAGSGKTFLPVAAAMDQIYASKEKKYDCLIISRSNSLNKNEDLGFLPGDPDEKMGPLIQPVRDSIENLLRIKNGGKYEEKTSIDQQVEEIFETCITTMAMKYVRGRSLVNKIALLDEAQNITPNQAFDFLSRAGQGTKIVMVGDVEQVDNPLLDKYTNGLTYAAHKMRGEGVAIINFEQSDIVRSRLARLAMERMKSGQAKS